MLTLRENPRKERRLSHNKDSSLRGPPLLPYSPVPSLSRSITCLSLLCRLRCNCYGKLRDVFYRSESEVVLQYPEEVAHPVDDRCGGGCSGALPHGGPG